MTAAELDTLGDQMLAADIELFQAQKAGDVDRQITALRTRSAIWASYRRHLAATDQDWSGVAMAAQRDRISAAELEGWHRR
jgi:hypothetical protein